MKLSTRSTGERMFVSLSSNLFSPSFDFKELCLFSCIRGRLLEVNEAILETPSLLLQKVKTSTQHLRVIVPVFTTKRARSLVNISIDGYGFNCHLPTLRHFNVVASVKRAQPSTDGYIAVILPKFEESKSITENLLSREEFEKVLAKRAASPQLS